ncbi:MAG: ketoacyl-ACP synthase III [Actinobacteria bacterium]|nr:ketoacyl-ACP synthase III [Actinomycetota bacterium]MCA1740699.1 ketoacyl-ACP synthase III [Actinomycetota bacterium]
MSGVSGNAAGRILGVGRALGSRVVTNHDLEKVLDTDDAWVVERTGIKKRHFVADDEDCATLAAGASKAALAHAGLESGEIDLILCATSTAPESMPSVACLVGEAIGASGAGAFDVSAACTGYSYAASVAHSMLGSGVARCVLVIGADVMTTIVDQNERSTAVIFGDGAGAVILEKGDGESGFVDHILGADGRMAQLGHAGHPGTQNKLYQNGREVFKFAVRIFPEMVEKLLARNEVSPEEVQYVIPHQANARIIRAAIRKMEIPEGRVVVNLDRFGNTSAASIPLSYPDIFESFEAGRYIVTVGFGFGLTWAANLYRI